ncbi:hypothetical protein [Pyrobaculum aerophilum]|uniref:Uncharacterized protein n=3 Tax=Pyrobaculum aerophilum TaxID=13773 RepID=Q8ZU28_PYRAE|nr:MULTISPECIES: hypothetical protein [Pyrobaculum]AAL64580.1 conserved hypothetical protein [Pyrobaculum aerophilum str. IM2]RFA96698.1 hypothetical protein CGL51_04965 [Pyrobaculum aerophilum]RFB00327.1 hypothetical protein CGL52_00205 [Pyrobaculum aerophilum]HII47424.1 hypothetical protein [Pyrobaculum aerophilum]
MSLDVIIITGIALLMLLLFTYMFWRESAIRNRERPAEVYTVIRCGDGAERRRKYQEGDYVGKPAGDCAGGVIIGIFKEVRQE